MYSHATAVVTTYNRKELLQNHIKTLATQVLKPVERIEYPDVDRFIAADDIEYCVFTEREGARIIVAGKNRIEHPESARYAAQFSGRSLICLRPAWKRYYDMRNRLLIARKYYGMKLLTQSIPGSFIRLFAGLIHEHRGLSQICAFFTGMIDGLLGFQGHHHARWHFSH